MNILEFKPISYHELNLALGKVELSLPEKLLEWIAGQNVDFIEDKFSIAGKEIFRFQASTENRQTTLFGFGRSENRKVAAVKAAAELIERVVYHRFIKNGTGLNLSLEVRGGEWEVQESSLTHAIEQSFHNSNGWAVDYSANKAIERALRESLERHILLLSFIKNGWNGFFQVDRTKISHFDFRSLVSRYSVAGFSAGLSICQCPSFPGASFGYLCDRNNGVLTSDRWEQSFYEAYDYLRVREGHPEADGQNDLISKELAFYLKEPFKENFNTTGQVIEVCPKVTTNLAVIDLKESLGLPISFYAAVVHGGDLLPLYLSPTLSPAGRDSLQVKFRNLGIECPIPERHPIL